MSKRLEYHEVTKERFYVAGIRQVTPQAGGLWAIVKTDGSMERMEETAGKGKVDLGLCFGFQEDGSNDYMVGFQTDQKTLEGYEVVEIPAGHWLVFFAEGQISQNVLGRTWKEIHEQWIDSGKAGIDGVPTIEDYAVWNEREDRCLVRIYVMAKEDPQ